MLMQGVRVVGIICLFERKLEKSGALGFGAEELTKAGIHLVQLSPVVEGEPAFDAGLTEYGVVVSLFIWSPSECPKNRQKMTIDRYSLLERDKHNNVRVHNIIKTPAMNQLTTSP